MDMARVCFCNFVFIFCGSVTYISTRLIMATKEKKEQQQQKKRLNSENMRLH